MATGSGIIRKVSGKVGDLVYTVRSGEQLIRGVPSKVRNPRTELQMAQRMKWPNVLAAYRALQPYMKDCFETKLTIKRQLGNVFFTVGEGFVDGKKCVSGEFSFALVKLEAQA